MTKTPLLFFNTLKVRTLLSFLSLTQISYEISARTPCGTLQIRLSIWILWLCATPCDSSLQPSPWLTNFELPTSLRTPCTASMPDLHFHGKWEQWYPSWDFHRWTLNPSTHSLRTFHCTPCRNSCSDRETIETHSLTLSDFKYLTWNHTYIA
jgi:hypothetical protein